MINRNVLDISDAGDLREKFPDTVAALSENTFGRGDNFEKIFKGKKIVVHSMRTSLCGRMLITSQIINDKKYWMLFRHLPDHKYPVLDQQYMQQYISKQWPTILKQIEELETALQQHEELKPSAPNQEVISSPTSNSSSENEEANSENNPNNENENNKDANEKISIEDLGFFNNQLIQPNEKQKELLREEKSSIACGMAGTGKSYIAKELLEDALEKEVKKKRIAEKNEPEIKESEAKEFEHKEIEDQEPGRVMYITASKKLKNNIKTMWEMSPSSKETDGCDIEFKTYLDLIQELVPSIKNKKLAQKKNFTDWVLGCVSSQREFKKQLDTFLIDAPDADLKELLYQECRIISGYSEADYIKIGNRQSIFSTEGWSEADRGEFRKKLYRVLTKYREHLNSGNFIDPSFFEINDEILSSQRISKIVVDESQDLSLLQLKILATLAKKQNTTETKNQVPYFQNITYFLDTHQSLSDNLSKIPYLKELLDKENTHILTESKRCSQRIVDVANAILQMKYKVTGGAVDKDKDYCSEMTASDSAILGNVFWIDQPNPDEEKLMLNAVKSHKCTIITLPEFVEDAERKFGKDAQILTIDQAKGLEFDSVIAYRLFENERYYNIDKVLQKNHDVEKTKGRAKQGRAHHEYDPDFSVLFTTATRARNTFYIYNDLQDPKLLKTLKEKNLNQKEEKLSEDKEHKALWEIELKKKQVEHLGHKIGHIRAALRIPSTEQQIISKIKEKESTKEDWLQQIKEHILNVENEEKITPINVCSVYSAAWRLYSVKLSKNKMAFLELIRIVDPKVQIENSKQLKIFTFKEMNQILNSSDKFDKKMIEIFDNNQADSFFNSIDDQNKPLILSILHPRLDSKYKKLITHIEKFTDTVNTLSITTFKSFVFSDNEKSYTLLLKLLESNNALLDNFSVDDLVDALFNSARFSSSAFYHLAKIPMGIKVLSKLLESHPQLIDHFTAKRLCETPEDNHSPIFIFKDSTDGINFVSQLLKLNPDLKTQLMDDDQGRLLINKIQELQSAAESKITEEKNTAARIYIGKLLEIQDESVFQSKLANLFKNNSICSYLFDIRYENRFLIDHILPAHFRSKSLFEIMKDKTNAEKITLNHLKSIKYPLEKPVTTLLHHLAIACCPLLHLLIHNNSKIIEQLTMDDLRENGIPPLERSTLLYNLCNNTIGQQLLSELLNKNAAIATNWTSEDLIGDIITSTAYYLSMSKIGREIFLKILRDNPTLARDFTTTILFRITENDTKSLFYNLSLTTEGHAILLKLFEQNKLFFKDCKAEELVQSLFCHQSDKSTAFQNFASSSSGIQVFSKILEACPKADKIFSAEILCSVIPSYKANISPIGTLASSTEGCQFLLDLFNRNANLAGQFTHQHLDRIFIIDGVNQSLRTLLKKNTTGVLILDKIYKANPSLQVEDLEENIDLKDLVETSNSDIFEEKLLKFLDKNSIEYIFEKKVQGFPFINCILYNEKRLVKFLGIISKENYANKFTISNLTQPIIFSNHQLVSPLYHLASEENGCKILLVLLSKNLELASQLTANHLRDTGNYRGITHVSLLYILCATPVRKLFYKLLDTNPSLANELQGEDFAFSRNNLPAPAFCLTNDQESRTKFYGVLDRYPHIALGFNLNALIYCPADSKKVMSILSNLSSGGIGHQALLKLINANPDFNKECKSDELADHLLAPIDINTNTSVLFNLSTATEGCEFLFKLVKAHPPLAKRLTALVLCSNIKHPNRDKVIITNILLNLSSFNNGRELISFLISNTTLAQDITLDMLTNRTQFGERHVRLCDFLKGEKDENHKNILAMIFNLNKPLEEQFNKFNKMSETSLSTSPHSFHASKPIGKNTTTYNAKKNVSLPVFK